MAGQRPRSRERHRADGGDGAERDHQPRRPPGRDPHPAERDDPSQARAPPDGSRRPLQAAGGRPRVVLVRGLPALHAARDHPLEHARPGAQGAGGSARQLQDRHAVVQHGHARLQEVPQLPAQARLPAAVQGIQIGTGIRDRGSGIQLLFPPKADYRYNVVRRMFADRFRVPAPKPHTTWADRTGSMRCMATMKRTSIAVVVLVGLGFFGLTDAFAQDFANSQPPSQTASASAGQGKPQTPATKQAEPAKDTKQSKPQTPVKPDPKAQKPGAKPTVTPAPIVPAPAVPPPPGYVIGPDDVLQVLYWREKDVSAEVVVRPDGMISLPLLNLSLIHICSC